MKNARFLLTAAASAWAVAAAAGQAVPFTQGNLVVLQAGDAVTALSSAAAPMFLQEIRISDGAIIQTIALPTAVNGAHRAFTGTGTSTTEGGLALSVDGRFLLAGGYDAAPGTASVGTSLTATVNRVVARIAADGTVDTTTALSDTSFNASAFRGVASTDGTQLWMSGDSSAAANRSVRYTTFGSSSSTQILAAGINGRLVNIFDGQLYLSTMSGAFRGVNRVGTGLPTTPATETLTLLPGFDPSTTSTQDTEDFLFADSTTLYVCDQRSAGLAGGAGLQKWTFDSGTNTWTLAYTLTTGLTATVRHVTAQTVGGQFTLFCTTADAAAGGNKLVSVVDTGAGSAFTLVAQAPALTLWKGVDFAPAGATPPPVCYPNCDGSTVNPFLNVLDFNCFLNQFASGASYANCDGSTIPPVLNVLDFNCFLNSFSAGCSAP
jgi:hypothetical protein